MIKLKIYVEKLGKKKYSNLKIKRLDDEGKNCICNKSKKRI